MTSISLVVCLLQAMPMQRNLFFNECLIEKSTPSLHALILDTDRTGGVALRVDSMERGAQKNLPLKDL